MSAGGIEDDPAAVKAMIVYRRATGASVGDFRHDLAASEALVGGVPGVRRFSRSLTTESGYRKGDPVYDAVDELWFDDEAAARAALASPAFGGLRDGLGADPASVAVVLVNDHVIKQGTIREGSLKNYEFIVRRPDLSVDEFRRYWHEHHGPLACHIETMRHYVQSHAIDSEYADGRTPAWEGSAITWFDDIDGMRASGASTAYEATRADEENFLDAPLELPFIIATERVLIG